MKTKKLTQRILSAVISLATLLSLSTFASGSGFDDKDTSGNGQGTGNQGYQDRGNGSDAFYVNDQGLRISLVDTKTGKVYDGNVADFEIKRSTGYRLVRDDGDKVTKWGSSTATDPNSDGQYVKNNEDPILIDIDGETAPKPFVDSGNSFVGNGNALKAWLQKKGSNNTENILTLVKQIPGVDDETRDKIISGEIKIDVEPIIQVPIYEGNRFTGERYQGTVRDYIQYLRNTYPAEKGYSDYVRTGGDMRPVVKAALQSMFLENDDLRLKSLTPEQMEAYVDWYIMNGNLDELGAGLFIFDLKDKTKPEEPTPTEPVKSEGSIDITESRITRHKYLSEVDETLQNNEFNWEVPAFTNEDCSRSSCHHLSQRIVDKDNKVYIDEKEKPDQDKGVVKAWTTIDYDTSKKEYTRGVWGDDSFQLNGVEYSVTVVRLGDNINLPTYRSTGREGALGVIKCVGSGNQSTGRAGNGSKSFSVKLLFIDNGSGDYKTESEHKDYRDTTPRATETNPNPKHTHSSRTTTSTATTKFEEATKVEMNLNVNQYNYAGANGTTNDSKANGLTQHKGFSQQTWLELNYGTINFVPYIKMQYDTPTSHDNRVYVSGKYGRSLTVNEHVGVYFTPSNNNQNIVNTNSKTIKGKLSIQSNQWSTHATAIAKAGTLSVLPGGAVLDLAVLKENRQRFVVESIKPILAGSGLAQVVATGSSSLKNDDTTAKQEHVDFVKQVVEALEGLSVQQYVTNQNVDPKTYNRNVWLAGKEVNPTSKTDSKYYFRADDDKDSKTSGKSNMGDIDVRIGGANAYPYKDIKSTISSQTIIDYYTFFSDTAGNIKYKTGKSLAEVSTIGNVDSEGTVILKKGESSSAISNEDIIRINNKTHIVDKLVKALERNTGSDSDAKWVDDGHWYNEAFDGVTYVYQRTVLTLGTINPYIRSSVLDPQLTPHSSGKSDMFKYYKASQFKMREYSEVYGKGNEGKLADYRGVEFKTELLDTLFISDIFFIPNVTVQDLR